MYFDKALTRSLFVDIMSFAFFFYWKSFEQIIEKLVSFFIFFVKVVHYLVLVAGVKNS